MANRLARDLRKTMTHGDDPTGASVGYKRSPPGASRRPPRRRGGISQRPEPTVPACPERSASLVFTGSLVGLNTSPTPGMSRTLSVSRLFVGIAGATTAATILR